MYARPLTLLTGESSPVVKTVKPISTVDRNENRAQEIKELTSNGIIPHEHELQKHPEKSVEGRSWLMGRVAAMIQEVLPAKQIVDSMVSDAAQILQANASKVRVGPKL